MSLGVLQARLNTGPLEARVGILAVIGAYFGKEKLS